MKLSRRTFFKQSLVAAMAIGAIPKSKAVEYDTENVSASVQGGDSSSKFISFSEKGNNADIMLKGVESDFKVMHITDCHITVPSQKDEEVWEKCKRMHQAYKDTDSHESGKNVSREEAFTMLLNKAKNEKVDFIVLSGDIINFPSEASVDFVYKELQKCGIPYAYISGNHDWHLEGTPGSDYSQRKQMIGVLKPLYNGNNPFCYSALYKGVNFVCIDNSTYQVDSEQLAFFKQQLNKPYPIVLVMHIPVYTLLNNGNATFGNPKWGRAIDESYEIEKREPWSDKGNTDETKEFYNLVMNNDVIVLSGHIHTNRVDREKDLLQFVTGLSRNGVHRIINFKVKK